MKVSGSDQQGDIGVYAVALKVSQELDWIFRPQPLRDIGIDAHIEVVENGESKAEMLALQIKSGLSWFDETNEQGIIFRGDSNHLKYWCNYLLPVLVVLHDDRINTAYWQVVNKDTAISTGKGWKMIIPFRQKLERSSTVALKALCRSVIHADTFSILSLKDVSHPRAKRYSADLLIHNRVSQAEIISIVKKVTRDLINREYYQNDLIKQRWENTSANVVLLFVYLALEDFKNKNWFCRSCWIDENLEPKSRPVEINGSNIGENIVIDWSTNYKALADHYKRNTLNKENYLEISLRLLEQTKQLIQEIKEILVYSDKNTINSKVFTQKMVDFESQLTEIYQKSMNIGESPLECKDFANKFSCVMSSAHNIVLPFSESGLKTWEESKRNLLMRQAIQNYEHELVRLEYELEKIR
ncbi:MAG: DUF4365 domain-containing protein [Coleofasciculus sp.]|uniref:DUF4365 domain-containing protein n=1 Tax=Coleofasciculus sp. TaxID=3100458 RepID=UPI003A4165C1